MSTDIVAPLSAWSLSKTAQSWGISVCTVCAENLTRLDWPSSNALGQTEECWSGGSGSYRLAARTRHRPI